MPMLELVDVTVTYSGSERAALAHVDLVVDEGEWILVSAPTGAGKSTLLGLCNGLVPHFTGGAIHGSVVVAGRSTSTFKPRDLADVVGWVGQDPAAGFVTDSVEDELAFVMEEFAVPPATMRRRIEETLDLMGLVGLRNRPLPTLSGGEAQRVAIASVLCAEPRLLVLDEPTSALDPAGAEDVLAALGRLVHDVGLTVVMSEHRLERVVHLVDRIVLIRDGSVSAHHPDEAMTVAAHVPPVVELGRLIGWSPLPRSVRDARRLSPPLIDELTIAMASADASHPDSPGGHDDDGSRPPGHDRSATVSTSRVSLAHGRQLVLNDVSVDVHAGEICALMGRNGAGKTTLLRAVAGLGTPSSGQIRVGGRDPAKIDGAERIRTVGFVPQDPLQLLYSSTVAGECLSADRDGGLTEGTTHSVLRHLEGDDGIDLRHHPRDLSAGQQLLVALAIVLAPAPTTLLLDEPTRGLDHGVKQRLAALLRTRAARDDVAILLATHDVEFAAAVTDRVIMLANREVITAGSTAEVLSQSTVFAPQVARILSPLALLTVDDVQRALSRNGDATGTRARGDRP